MTQNTIPVTVDNAAEVARITKDFLREFDPKEVKIKPAKVSGNRALALRYIDARLVMGRLDEVVGFHNWQDAYTLLPTGEVECRLSVRIGGEWITKTDVGGQSEQPDDGDKMKSAYSDALKRAAVKFGIGRYLYRLPQEWMDYDPVAKRIIPPKDPNQLPAGARKIEVKPQPAKPAKEIESDPIEKEVADLRKLIAAVADRDDAAAAWQFFTRIKPRMNHALSAEFGNIFDDLRRKFPPPQQPTKPHSATATFA